MTREGLERKLLAAGHRLTNDASAPLVLSIESMDPLRADGVLAAVAPSEADYLSASVLDLVENRVLIDPVAAVNRLTSREGPVATAIQAQGDSALLLTGSAHIPLAATVGHLVGNRGDVGVLDWHPNVGDLSWRWPEDDDVTFPDLCFKDDGVDGRRVVVRFSLSFWSGPRGADTGTDAAMQAVAGQADRVVHLYHPGLLDGLGGLQGRSVRSRRQSLAYATAFREVMNSAVGAERVDVFYAGPLSVAFEIGRNVQATFHPPTTVWNYVAGRYPWGVELNPRGNGAAPLIPRAVVQNDTVGPSSSTEPLREADDGDQP